MKPTDPTGPAFPPHLAAAIGRMRETIRRSRQEHRDMEAMRRALARSEERYKALHANVPVGLYRRTPGPDGRLVMVNPALVSMFGYDSAEELNQVPVRNLYYHPEECEAFSNKLFRHKEVIKERLQMKKKDGTPFFIAVSTTVICDEDGSPEYFDGIMEDITDKVQLEEKERLQAQQLQQADKMASLGVLVSGMAHEINNPNQFIVSHLAVLENVLQDALRYLDEILKDNPDARLGNLPYAVVRTRLPSMIADMREGTRRIDRIVNELRDYARDTPTMTRDTIDLNRVCRSACSLVNSLITKSAGAFYTTFSEEPLWFIGDFHKVEQVVINLIQNACHAVAPTRGSISLRTRRIGEDLVELAVSDTGCGIAPEHMSRIFDPFFTTKRDDGGTGLGLAISDSIVRQLEGTLSLESEPQVGTTAILRFPQTGTPSGGGTP